MHTVGRTQSRNEEDQGFDGSRDDAFAIATSSCVAQFHRMFPVNKPLGHKPVILLASHSQTLPKLIND